jgi:hypothetical protein
VIVSATTPAETVLAWVTTAMCLPQGQYQLDVIALALLPRAAAGQERPLDVSVLHGGCHAE